MLSRKWRGAQLATLICRLMMSLFLFYPSALDELKLQLRRCLHCVL